MPAYPDYLPEDEDDEYDPAGKVSADALHSLLLRVLFFAKSVLFQCWVLSEFEHAKSE